MDDDGCFSPVAAEPSPPDPEQAPLSPHGDRPEFNEAFLALTRRLARRRATSMLHWNPVRNRDYYTLVLVWTPQDGDLYINDDAYGGGGFGAVPASGAATASLPQTTVGEEREEAVCAVCLEGYEMGQTLRTMPCSHGFHECCIFRWLRVSRLCPLCRFALPSEEYGGGRW